MPQPVYTSGVMRRRTTAAAWSGLAMPAHSAWPALLVTARTCFLSPSSACAQQLPPELAVGGPLHGLGDKQREERGRVDRSVVRTMWDLTESRELAAPQLVEDLARLLFGEVVDLLALILREQSQRAARDVGIPAERLVGADEAVASERDRVPRDAGRRVRTAVVELHERAQVQRAARDKALVVRFAALRVARGAAMETAVARVERIDGVVEAIGRRRGAGAVLGRDHHKLDREHSLRGQVRFDMEDSRVDGA